MIAITGASGLVGSSVVEKMRQSGLPVRAIVREGSRLDLLERHGQKLNLMEADVLDMPALLKAFEGAEMVIHCAALVSFNPGSRSQIFEVNVQGTRNVVNTCLRLGVPRLIHVSSIAALGRVKGSLLVNETNSWSHGAGQSDYGESKYLAELEVFRGKEEGLHISVINPSVVLSPGDGRRTSSRLFSYVWNRGAFYAGGNISYVDINDVCDMILKLHSDRRNGERYIASAGSVELKLILDQIARRLDRKGPSIKVGPWMMWLAAGFETWRSRMTGREPLITKQSARFVDEHVVYENTKAKQDLGMEFQSLESTLDWCCREFRNININK